MSVLSRVAALVVAIGLVVAALVVRDAREGDTELDDLLPGDEEVVASCAEELRELCLRAAPTDEVVWSFAPAAAQAAALEGTEPVAVVLPAAWADVADDARQRAGQPPLVRSDVVAHSPLLVVAFEDRATVLAAACGIEVADLGWQCIGEHAGSDWVDLGGDVRWGRVVPGHLPPETVTGLQATAAVVAARTGLPFSLADLRDVGFTTWFGRLERAVGDFTPPGGSHLTAMVTRGPSVANVAMATEAEVMTRGLDTAFGPIVVAAPDPLLEVELVVAGTDAALTDRVAALLEPATLATAGWRTGPEALEGAPLQDLPPPATTPGGGVLTALRDVWQDVAG